MPMRFFGAPQRSSGSRQNGILVLEYSQVSHQRQCSVLRSLCAPGSLVRVAEVEEVEEGETGTEATAEMVAGMRGTGDMEAAVVADPATGGLSMLDAAMKKEHHAKTRGVSCRRLQERRL